MRAAGATARRRTSDVISVNGISQDPAGNSPRRALRSSAPGLFQAATTRRFSRGHRLLKHADFERVYQKGARHFAGHMTVFYLARDEGRARVGFTVGRVLGGAVKRNRIRRRLREAVRMHFGLLTMPVDIVINPRKSALTADFTELLYQVGHAFELIAQREGRA